jgi:hypothetical protein
MISGSSDNTIGILEIGQSGLANLWAVSGYQEYVGAKLWYGGQLNPDYPGLLIERSGQGFSRYHIQEQMGAAIKIRKYFVEDDIHSIVFDGTLDGNNQAEDGYVAVDAADMVNSKITARITNGVAAIGNPGVVAAPLRLEELTTPCVGNVFEFGVKDDACADLMPELVGGADIRRNSYTVNGQLVVV